MTWRPISARPMALHVISRILNPHFLRYMTSYDVASNLCPALPAARKPASRSSTNGSQRSFITSHTTSSNPAAASVARQEGHREQTPHRDRNMTYHQGGRSYTRAGLLRRFKVVRVLVLKNPPARYSSLVGRYGHATGPASCALSSSVSAAAAK
jgi:hypothetical protein